MSDSALQLTKRELHQLVGAPRFWAIAIAVALVIGIAGPFGTFESLRILPRLAYWFAITVATFLIATAFTGFLARLIGGPQTSMPVRFAVIGFLAGLPVTLFVALVNSILFDTIGEFGGEVLHLLPYICPIAAVVAYVYAVFGYGESHSGAGSAASGNRRPALLDRLPAAKRGRLSHLTVQDHYVEVTTEKGSELVLMRLADAIRETDGTAGLQIHRSHWVALDAVAGAHRQNGRLFLAMRDGTRLPVSRSRIDEVRSAGLA